MGWVGNGSRIFIFSGLGHGSKMADLRKTDVVYITTSSFALGSNNSALSKFTVWRITASSLSSAVSIHHWTLWRQTKLFSYLLLQ